MKLDDLFFAAITAIALSAWLGIVGFGLYLAWRVVEWLTT